MELNRERLVKALNYWVKNFDGNVTDFKTLCEAISLINKLTTENKILISNNADLETELAVAYDLLEESQADTVRKMQEGLKERFRIPEINEVYSIAPFQLHQSIDQIAKEMLNDES